MAMAASPALKIDLRFMSSPSKKIESATADFDASEFADSG
jgi:hypothetical protein